MIKADEYYLSNLQSIKRFGSFDKNPRPKYADGTSAYTKFISQVFETYDLNRGEFPIITLRTTAIKTGIKEIFWVYQFQDNSLETAHNLGINWWNDWNIGDGTIGQRYGATVSKYDLMNDLLKGLVNDPFSRRHIINLYQYADLKESAGLHPCAYETLWSVREVDGEMYLDMTLIQRSQDYITASTINKIQYVALQMMVAGHCGYKIGKFCHYVHNLHVYDRHSEAMDEILGKMPLEVQPKLILKENKNFYDYTIEDFVITGTKNISKIKSPLELAI